VSDRVIVPSGCDDDVAVVERLLVAADGYRLAAHDFAPPGAVRGYAVIAPAMGVTQRYYAPFAAWLATHGIHALTFDYRGMGRSRPASLRGFAADLTTWARVDAGAALADVATRAGHLPIYWIGHSLGGQVVPMIPGADRIARLITVAGGSGYWRYASRSLRWRAPLLWYVIVPASLRIAGYFPGRTLRMVSDVPHGAMAQWRRWCLHPDYAPGAEGAAVRAEYAALRTPILSLSFTDDEYMSAASIASLHAFYSGANRQMVRLAPADIGVASIGHFGFFRERFAASLWVPYVLPALD